MTDRFNPERFVSYVKFGIRSTFRETGKLLAAVFIYPVMMTLLYMMKGDIGFIMAMLSGILFAAFFIPMITYGRINGPKTKSEAADYILTPVSKTEKFISFAVNTVILMPLGIIITCALLEYVMWLLFCASASGLPATYPFKSMQIWYYYVPFMIVAEHIVMLSSCIICIKGPNTRYIAGMLINLAVIIAALLGFVLLFSPAGTPTFMGRVNYALYVSKNAPDITGIRAYFISVCVAAIFVPLAITRHKISTMEA